MEPLKDLEKSGLLDHLPPGVQPYTLFNNHVRPLDLAPEEVAALALGMSQFHPKGASTLSGYAYLGQFLAHDISRLREGSHDLRATPFECDRLISTVTSRLDLGSVYDGATADSPLRKPGTAEMKLGAARCADGGSIAGYDLHRDQGEALIADERNDENLIVAQLHLQFLKLHNFFVHQIQQEEPALETETLFNAAKEQVVLHYQDVILYDFLYEVIHPDVWKAVVYHKESIIWDPVPEDVAVLPLEFAGAVGRFGHSMVRRTYDLNRYKGVTVEELFDQTGQGDIDGRSEESGHLPATFLIDWLLFFDFSRLTTRARRPVEPNRATRISPGIAFKLKHTESLPCGEGSDLAMRNISRARQLGAGCGQDMVDHYLSCHSEKLERHNIQLEKLDDKALGRYWPNPPLKDCKRLYETTPLWFYILAEAYDDTSGVKGKLGVLGSLILAESILGLLKLDADSVIHNAKRRCDIPGTKIIDGEPFLQMSDLIFAATPDLPDPTTLSCNNNNQKDENDEC